MSGNVKTIDPSSNLCEAVAALNDGDTLILSPGVYNVDDRVVVNKDVVVKSSTDDPRDVVIVREGATVLFVKKGASTFENITFVSTSPTENSFIEKDDDVRMRGAVAVRGGSPVFKGCRATAAKQNGFSVVGLGVSAQFIRCLTQETNLAGILFANGATGVVDECVLANGRIGCLLVDATPEGQRVEARNSKFVKSQSAGLVVVNKGRVQIADCEIVADAGAAALVNDSTLEGSWVRFRGLVPFDSGDEATSALGLDVDSSSVFLTDSSFKDLSVGVCFENSSLTLEKCEISDGSESIVSHGPGKGLKLVDCSLFKKPSFNVTDDEEDEDDWEDDDDEESLCDDEQDFMDSLNALFDFDDEDIDGFSREEYAKANAIKDRKIKQLLGSAAPKVYGSFLTFEMGGPLNAFIYPNSKYGGTFVVTKELVDPDFNSPGNATFHSYELAIATRQKCPDDRMSGRPSKSAVMRQMAKEFSDFLRPPRRGDEDWFDKTINRYAEILTEIARHVLSGKTLDRFHALAFPKDYESRAVAGKCFVVDALGTPLPSSRITLQQSLSFFDRDLYEIPTREDDEIKRDPNEKGTFGLLLVIEITKREMNRALKIGSRAFIAELKENDRWPFSDIERKKRETK